jgi:uncharacterized membrane protein YgdD (TMEM256/DUF423 family)
MKSNKQIAIVGILGALAVGLGAFGAHTLKNQIPGGLITLEQLNGFDTGVKYQMYHTLAMLLIVLLKQNYSQKHLNAAYYFFLAGIILFSGSLYFLTTRNLYNADYLKALGPVTPIGGLCFIVAWLLLVFSAFKKDK